MRPSPPAALGPGAVALLERRAGMTPDLFTRYWRDVHGVLATRIPGFDRYTQFHLDRVPLYASDDHAAPMAVDGIAEVVMAAAGKAGLTDSRVADHIRRDEQNLFAHALLSSQPAGSSHLWSDAGDLESRDGSALFAACDDLFVLMQAGAPMSDGEAAFLHLLRAVDGADGIVVRRSHILSSGDTAWWDTPNVANASAGSPYVAVARLGIRGDAEAAVATVAAAAQAQSRSIGPVALHRVEARYVMVAEGRPTELGLRGMDPLRTIVEAGADNQRQEDLLSLIYAA